MLWRINRVRRPLSLSLDFFSLLIPLLFVLTPSSPSLSLPSSGISFPLLTELITTASTKASTARLKPLSELFQTLILVLPHLQELISSPVVGMSDDIVIQIVYISIGPFFIADPQLSGKGRSEKAVKGKTADAAMGVLGGKSGLRGLRMAALGLLRTVSSGEFAIERGGRRGTDVGFGDCRSSVDTRTRGRGSFRRC